MEKCWASKLGDCCETLSREHLISAALFKNTKSIIVEGFSWCQNEEKEVGVSSLTSKILCKHHNSLLSELDSAAGHAFNLFETIAKYIEEAKHNNGRFKVRKSDVHALFLERWLLKTLINISFQQSQYIGNGTEVGIPDEDLVKISFGKRQFLNGSGMYMASAAGSEIGFSSQLKIIPLVYSPDNRIDGAMFIFAGIHLFLWLKPEAIPLDFRWLAHVYPDCANFKPSRPFRRMVFKLPSGDSHTIKFNW